MPSPEERYQLHPPTPVTPEQLERRQRIASEIASLRKRADEIRNRLVADTPDYENGEPAPIPNSGSSMHDLVIADMKSRKKYGHEKYGTYLQAFNGRNALKDAYEEVLDLAVYLRQAVEESQSHESDDTGAQNTTRRVVSGPVSTYSPDPRDN